MSQNFEPQVLDSSAIRCYMECPRKYYYRMVLGYTSKKTPPYFSFGSAYHLFREKLEVYYKEEQNDLEAVYLKAGEDALNYWKEHGVEDPPGSKWDFLNSSRLIASFKEAYKTWVQEKKDKKIVVLVTEQAFTLQLPNDGPLTGGRFDQIVRWNGRVWGRDFKTSSKLGDFYERSLEPNDQFTRYTWAESQLSGEKLMGQIVEVLYNSKKEGPKILRFTTTRNDYQMEDWLKSQYFIAETIKRSRESGVYPMNDRSCVFCEYHGVCKMPGEGSVIQRLKSEFKHEPWKFDREDK